MEIQEIAVSGYELVQEVRDTSVGLHGFIALHRTTLGPALGGIRMYPYTSSDKALEDVLRLSRGMTYKSALAELGLGGGKSVIIGDPSRQKTEGLLRAFGEAIDTLKGRYICAEDMGTTTDDMRIIKQVTPYVTALSNETSSGDPSPFTAWGIVRGLQALSQMIWQSSNLQDKVIAVQGLGKVGGYLAELLFWQGAQLVVCDTNIEKAAQIAVRYGAEVVSPEAIFDVDCDLFSPCAFGGILNESNISRFQCRGIAGSANNQLLDPADGLRLLQRDILYAPDYATNAGGIINVAMELEPAGYNARLARGKVDRIYDTLCLIFSKAHALKLPTSVVADQLAEEKLQLNVGKRLYPPRFNP